MNTKLRRYVEKLLAGQARPSDLVEIFLIIRETNHSRETVKEVGDAVAHSTNRTRGLATRLVRDHAAMMRGIAPLFFQPKEGPSIVPTAQELKAALDAKLRLEPDLAKEIGLRPEVLRSVLGSAKKKILRASFHEGELKIELLGPTEREQKVVEHITRTFSFQGAFTDDDLIEDFIYVLTREKALAVDEQPRIRALKNPVAMFAICRLSGAHIRISDDCVLQLNTSLIRDMEVGGTHRYPNGSGFTLPIFCTGLKAKDVLTKALTSIEHCDFEQLDNFRLKPV